MKLISMTDYVLNEIKEISEITNFSYSLLKLKKVKNYANFLKQPLTLGMFVPCDDDGNALEEPKNYELWEQLHNSEGSTIGFKEHEQYQQAKSKVLFEGFSTIQQGENTIVMKGDFAVWITWTKRDVEFLVSFAPTLTQSAIDKLK